jgi:predicted nucleotidyltransferase
LRIDYYNASAEAVAERLRSILNELPEVKIAVLFGSITRRNVVRDVDVGVYLDPQPRLRDLIKISNLLEDALGIPVDLVPLADAPPRLRLKAMLEGVRLIVRDRRLYDSLLIKSLGEAMDLDLKLATRNSH